MPRLILISQVKVTVPRHSRHDCRYCKGQYKLHPPQVITIQQLFDAGYPRQQIGDKFGVSASHVSNIGNGRFWPEVSR